MKKLLVLSALLTLIMSGCGNNSQSKNLIIFHAGSLSMPVRKLNEAFEKANPGVRILSEAAGSIVCARKVTELDKPCDIVLSADYFVIDKILIPDHASWNIKFATNEIVIGYRPESKYASEITAENCHDILLRDDVVYGRSDPDADPCGYRTVFVSQLSEDYYGRPGLADSLMNKDRKYMRPKEVDLVALLEAGVIDYMFQYKSVSIQHGFSYIELPDSLNLSDINLKDQYGRASYMIPGSEPGLHTEVRGDYICYSGTIIENAPEKALATKYFAFLLSEEGRAIFLASGQEPVIPAVTDQSGAVPQELVSFIRDTLNIKP
ncbi:MAG: tungstate ABC transporter substrate-binding protein WtpA [Bacteroidia bacterium]|nr:MAG: tungstate ABC transporter substrate-binding protein WtpA [Bacteroidia bacterium]